MACQERMCCVYPWDLGEQVGGSKPLASSARTLRRLKALAAELFSRKIRVRLVSFRRLADSYRTLVPLRTLPAHFRLEQALECCARH